MAKRWYEGAGMRDPKLGPGWIRVLIHGLFSCAFEDKAQSLMVYALYNRPPNHEPAAFWKVRGSTDATKISLDEGSQMALAVSNGGGIGTYEATSNLDPTDANASQFDFRWIADFEHPGDFYQHPCVPKFDGVGAKFQIAAGTVSTLIRSNFLSKSKNQHRPARWRRIAQVIAIDIDFQMSHGTIATLAGNRHEPITMTDPFTQYDIVLRYDCGDAGCQGDPRDSDFNNLFDMFTPPSMEQNNFLISADPVPSGSTPPVDRDVQNLDNPAEQLSLLWPLFDPSKLFRSNTRQDPCGMGFFGQSGGLP